MVSWLFNLLPIFYEILLWLEKNWIGMWTSEIVAGLVQRCYGLRIQCCWMGVNPVQYCEPNVKAYFNCIKQSNSFEPILVH